MSLALYDSNTRKELLSLGLLLFFFLVIVIFISFLSSNKLQLRKLSGHLCFCVQVYLSTRRGAWVLNRVGDNGIPLDLTLNRVLNLLAKILPYGFVCSTAEGRLNQRFDHALYNLKPKHRYYFKAV